MVNTDDDSKRVGALRQRAEEMARAKECQLSKDRGGSIEEAQATIHELRVHQIELEMQNEELRRTQSELDLAKARYFDLYDLAPVGYCTVSMDGRILESNLTAVKLLGIDRKALLNLPITGFILQEDQDIYYLHRRELIEKGEHRACELRMMTKDGKAFWANLVATLGQGSLGSGGSESGDSPIIRLTISDITNRKRAEEDKILLEGQLQQSQKLETLGVLAGGVAHDFNNLLAAILGYANLGSMAVGPDGIAAPFLSAIEKAAMRASDLTRQLLAYAGKGKYVVTEVDLDIVLKEVLQILSVSIPSRVAFEYDLADRLPFVKGDATQILQILMNLISNACEAIPEGEKGTITVRTRSESINEATVQSGSWVLPLLPGRYSTLEVTDTGMGMSCETQARIFEPFFTTKFTGRGLGLSAVIGILGSHGGGLRVQSEQGRGSSFKIFLPAMQGSRSVPEGDAMPVWRGKGQILVVDDDRDVRSMARKMGEHLGFSVMEAPGGEEAIEIFRSQHGDFVLIILDLTMPRMNGWDTFRALQEIDREVPIILSSGYDVEGMTMPVVGLSGFLNKPYRIAEFQGVLQRTLDPLSLARE